jgi:hypothetical protein
LLLGRLLLAAAIGGLVEAAIGGVQLAKVTGNSAVAMAATGFPSDVHRAIANLESSATICLWAGGAALLFLVARPLVLRALPKAKMIVWMIWTVVILGNLLLVGDASVGLTAYTDPDRNLAREELVNGLILVPGRSLALSFVEAAVLGLLVWIAVLMRREETLEHLKIRTEAAADPSWDAMIAARRAASSDH